MLIEQKDIHSRRNERTNGIVLGEESAMAVAVGHCRVSTNVSLIDITWIKIVPFINCEKAKNKTMQYLPTIFSAQP